MSVRAAAGMTIWPFVPTVAVPRKAVVDGGGVVGGVV
jgi:hypothetical protein